MSHLEVAIVQTLAFFDQYDRPLELEEIHNFLWKAKASLEELQTILDRSENIISQGGWYCLRGREEIIRAHRRERFVLENQRWERVRKYISYLQWIPGVKLVAVCNTLAFAASKPESDIDLFIVIRKGRMWMTRLLITTVLHVLKVRRHHQKIAGRFCLSFFVTEDALDMRHIALPGEDIYLAYWMATITPVIDRGAYISFMSANKNFIAESLPNFFRTSPQHLLQSNRFSKVLRKSLEFLGGGLLGDIAESLVRLLLYRRTKRKAQQLDAGADVRVSDTMLKFHNVDRRRKVREMWEAECQVILKAEENMVPEKLKAEVFC